jgi:glycosyltransferase involved in cell wall biosynthesis
MPKLLYLITEDWFFVSHFLPMARAARAAGFEVVVATRVRAHGERIAAEGCRVVHLENERRSFGPFEALRGFFRIARIVRDEKPAIVHCIAIRMVVVGGLAALWGGARNLVLAPTGLGHLWINEGLRERIARGFARIAAGRWLRRPGTRYLFENSDDPREFGLGPGDAVTIVPGAGVKASEFPVTPEPQSPPLKVAVVARMIWPKGIAEAVAAVKRARALGADVTLDLYGSPDLSNRRTCTEDDLRALAEPGIAWRGRSGDVAQVWREHHVAMLLTWYREGVPRSIIEAAAAGRPILTTDVPGCRDLVRDGVEGFVVAPRDVEAAAQALLRLAGDAALRARLGAAAHARFEERFTEETVRRTVTDLYASFGVDPE